MSGDCSYELGGSGAANSHVSCLAEEAYLQGQPPFPLLLNCSFSQGVPDQLFFQLCAMLQNFCLPLVMQVGLFHLKPTES